MSQRSAPCCVALVHFHILCRARRGEITSRSAASRDALRTSGFSVLFLLMTCQESRHKHLVHAIHDEAYNATSMLHTRGRQCHL